MPHITICPACGRCYEECSEEWASREDRRCIECYHEMLAMAEEVAADERRRLENEAMDAHYRKHPHGY